jgi:hypothetical protein
MVFTYNMSDIMTSESYVKKFKCNSAIRLEVLLMTRAVVELTSELCFRNRIENSYLISVQSPPSQQTINNHLTPRTCLSSV